MTMLAEYTGVLIGGPAEGKLVTTLTPRFPIEDTTHLWLDGMGDNKTCTVQTLKGSYVWNEDEQCFYWNLEFIDLSTR